MEEINEGKQEVNNVQEVSQHFTVDKRHELPLKVKKDGPASKEPLTILQMFKNTVDKHGKNVSLQILMHFNGYPVVAVSSIPVLIANTAIARYVIFEHSSH
jgi:hypothetical protein